MLNFSYILVICVCQNNHNTLFLGTYLLESKISLNIPQNSYHNEEFTNIRKKMLYVISLWHNGDAIMGTIASQITCLTIVYSTVCSDADQRKHQSSASLAFVLGIHRGPVNSPHKWPVTRQMVPFDDVIMNDIRLKSVTTDLQLLYTSIH